MIIICLALALPLAITDITAIFSAGTVTTFPSSLTPIVVTPEKISSVSAIIRQRQASGSETRSGLSDLILFAKFFAVL